MHWWAASSNRLARVEQQDLHAHGAASSVDRWQAGFPQGPEWKAGAAPVVLFSTSYCAFAASAATGLQSGQGKTNWRMASLKCAAIAVAAILVREGIDYAQSKAVFKAARERAGLRAAPERRLRARRRSPKAWR